MLLQLVKLLCITAGMSGREVIQGLPIEAGQLPSKSGSVVLCFDAIGGKAVEFFEIRREAEVFGEKDVVPSVLVHADGMDLAGPVAQGIAAVAEGRVGKRVIVQGKGRQVVIADHGFIGTVDDDFQGQRRMGREETQLREGKFQRGGGKGDAVVLQEFCGDMIEEVEGEVSLQGQAGLLGKPQGAKVADEQAVRMQGFKGAEPGNEFTAFAPHGGAWGVDDEPGAGSVSDFYGLPDAAEGPGTARPPGFTADIDGGGAVLAGSPEAGDVCHVYGKAARLAAVRRRDGFFLLQDVVLQASFFDGFAEESRLALAIEADGSGIRLAEGKGGGEVAGTAFVELLPVFFVDGVADRVSEIAVNSAAIGSDDTAHEVCRAHASLNLEGADAGLDELGNAAVHAHVFEGKLVRAGAIGIEDFFGLLVDELIGPAAWLQAAAAVAALTEQDTGVDALAAFRDAHVAVDEVFDFDTGAFTEEGQFGEGHFAADDDAGDAVFFEALDGGLVMGVHHDGGVQRKLDAKAAHELKDSKVLDKDRVGLDLAEIEQVFFERRQFVVADEVVDGDV